MSPTYENIGVDVRDDAAIITLRRPPLNVLNIAMMGEMNDALDTLAGNQNLKAIVFQAQGKNFCAGVDVGEHRGEIVRQMLATFHGLFRRLVDLNIPTLCAVRGVALGGGMELATFADIVIAAETARFGVPEIKLAVYPPVAIATLTPMVGAHRAAEMVLTGDNVDAWEAYRIGLVNRVVADHQVEEELEKMLARLRDKSAAALRITRKALHLAEPERFSAVLQRVEELYFAEMAISHDSDEGLSAFLEKRAPVWKNA